MSNILYDKDIIRHDRIIPGQSGDGMDASEYAALRADMDTMLARPVVLHLTDIPDVATGPADGDALTWDAATETWELAPPGGSIAEIEDRGSVIRTSVDNINFTAGLRAVTSTTNPAGINAAVDFGGTGSQNVVARADHYHSLRVDVPLRWSASGSHSSGTRTLASGTVSGLVPGNSYIIKGQASGHLRGEGAGAGYTLPRITIHGTVRDAPDRPRTVAGVQVPFHLMHQGVAVTGISDVSVSCTLAYSEGDPVYVGGGELMISVTSNR